MASQSTQPVYGRRLLIDNVDDVVASNPSRPFVYISRTDKAADGWEAVSFGQFAHAIDHVAWQLTNRHGPGFQDKFPTVAYIGSNDVRYLIVMLGCIKAGYQALLLSPRNTKEAQESLLDATDCRIFWHTDNFVSQVDGWVSGRDVETYVVPSSRTLLDSTPEPFPYHRTFDQGRWDPGVVLHTSGSTGTPKPVTMRQGSFVICDALRSLPKLHGGEFIMQAYGERATRAFMPMPLFHAAGLIFAISTAFVYGTPLVLGLDRPLTGNLVLQCLKHTDIDGALLPPVILEELSKNTEAMAELAKLNYVIFGGGNLGQKAGQTLVDHGVVLSNAIASTECCPYSCHFQTDMDNWQYFIFNSVMGCDWRLFSEQDNTYELVLRRRDKEPAQQAVFYTFPHLDEWSTKDLFKPHPTLSDHWMFCGRVDDVIVFSSGEKLNPVSMEQMILGHPSVKGALVVGSGRFQSALILEPSTPCEDDETVSKVINKVWPLIEKANSTTVAHGRIAKWLVGIAPRDKPFLRTPKGTVLRRKTIKLLENEINSLYEKQPNEHVDLDLTSEEALARSIANLISMTGISALAVGTDFFTAGFDSLRVVSLVRKLKGAGLASHVTSSTIYQNSTAARLARYIYSTMHGTVIDAEQETKVMKQLLEKYTHDLPLNKNKPEPLFEGQTVLITGTTGSLGAYMLDTLCQLDHVKKVIALNRDQDGGSSRQPSISKERGLGTDFAKVEFLRADLSLLDLGLGNKYEEVSETIDRIIHNAWPVNFNLGVQSFEPQIRGVRHLVDLSAAAAKLVPIVFLSTIGSAGAWTQKRPVPEAQLEDLRLAQMGYGQAKLVGSLMFDAAADKGIPTATIRVGQIAGPRSSKGVWNPHEYIPSLVASSVYLGALPYHLGSSNVVDWIPVEDVADIVLDVAGVKIELPLSETRGYFHAVNPVAVSWSDLVPVIKNHYGIQELVSLEEWISRLSASGGGLRNPGVKLLDTYRGMLANDQAGRQHVCFSMQKTKTCSPTVGRLSGITPALVRNWCRQWEF